MSLINLSKRECCDICEHKDRCRDNELGSIICPLISINVGGENARKRV